MHWSNSVNHVVRPCNCPTFSHKAAHIIDNTQLWPEHQDVQTTAGHNQLV